MRIAALQTLNTERASDRYGLLRIGLLLARRAVMSSALLPLASGSAGSRAQDLAQATDLQNAAKQQRADAARATKTSLVKPFRTQLAAAETQVLLKDALTRVTGEEPSNDCVAILTAQWAHETGRGASMYNYNFAGIKGTGPSGMAVAQRTKEGWGNTEKTITDNFRAYASAEEGATDYVKLLARRFPDALEAAKSGDAVGTVRALKDKGYFTGNEEAYTRSVVRMAREFAPESSNLSVEQVNAAWASAHTIVPVGERGASTPAGSAYGGASFPALFGPTPFVDALALSDEVSRAALNAFSRTHGDEEHERRT
jgi:flagellum-specific peptidoglycan hydrolase FlgJ